MIATRRDTLEVREVLTGLVLKPERILPFRRSRVIWQNNIKINFKRIRFEFDDRIYLAEHIVQRQAIVKAVITFVFQ